MVFSILALVTLPVSTVRSPRVSAVARWVSVVIRLSSIPGRAAGSLPAPDLFSPRAAASRPRPARWSTGSAAGKSARSSPCAAPPTLPCLLRGSSQFAAASLKPSRAGDESRWNGQFVRRKSQRFSGRRFVDSRHFKQDASRLHHRYPFLRRAFALAHARFRGLFGERLVRENPNPQLSAALDEPRDGHARSFNLPVGDPRAFHGLQPVLAERQLSAAPRLAFAAPAHLLPVLHLFRHQHRSVLASSSRAGPTASGPTILSLLFALTPLLQFRVRSESSKRASECSRPDRPSTSRQSPRTSCRPARIRNRCPRAASAAAAAPAGTTPCARFPRRSAGPPRAP